MKLSSKSVQSSAWSSPELNRSFSIDLLNNDKISEPGKTHFKRLTKELKRQWSHCFKDGYKTPVTVNVFDGASGEAWPNGESRCR